MTAAVLSGEGRSPVKVVASAAPVVVLLWVLPYVLAPYKTLLLTYGLVMAIAAHGFSLLLG